MQAEQSLREGHLQESLAQLQEQVRRDPGNAKNRVFLFQLLCILGDWNRAMTQLNVAGELDAGTLAMVQTYREALHCEALRAEVFAGQRYPLVLGKPEQWLADLLEALRLTAEGRYAQAQPLRDNAFALAPATAGTLNGQAFQWIADADTRLGPVLEAIVNGRYYWIPFCQIQQITVEAPADLRDLVWLPAQFVFANAGAAVGLIPARYPGSECADADAIRLGRETRWLERGGGFYEGLGQRMFTTDGGDYPLLEVRTVALATATQAAAMGQGGG
jgi:type VI secretion system protein ImpE